MKFDRLVPDDQRLNSEAPLSAANENAKTEALEGLFNNFSPDATVSGRGTQSRNKKKFGETLVAYTTDFTGMGGGRYHARTFIKMQNAGRILKNKDLDIDMMGRQNIVPDCEVWYAPEIGTANHDLLCHPTDPNVATIVCGVIINFDGFNRPIILVTAMGGMTISWGKVAEAWEPGDTRITLTPVFDAEGTEIPGAGNVDIIIQMPAGTVPLGFGNVVDDVLPYMQGFLLSYKHFPDSTAQYDYLGNAGDETSPNFIPMPIKAI